MLNQQTLNQLKALRLDGMARSFEEQLILAAATELSFEERFALLVDREILWRDNKRRDRLLKQAQLKQPQACLEDLDHRPGRGLDKPLIATLANGDWIRQGHALLIGGATGTGRPGLPAPLVNRLAAKASLSCTPECPACSIPSASPMATAASANDWRNWPASTCSSWTTGDSLRWTKVPGTICSKSSTTASAAVPRSSPVNSPSITGTAGSTIPP